MGDKASKIVAGIIVGLLYMLVLIAFIGVLLVACTSIYNLYVDFNMIDLIRFMLSMGVLLWIFYSK